MKRHLPLLPAAFMLVACLLFLWMFFAASTLERTVDLGGISAPTGRDVRVPGYNYAAKWRHGMAGNSPLYMPGFFAAAIATWFWCAGKRLSRTLLEGALIIIAATVCASVLAPFTAPRILHNFVSREEFNVSQATGSGSWIAYAQGIYSLLTWISLIVASRFSIQLQSFKPLLVPLALNLILAFVRPWTVADFTSQWLRRALTGEITALISLMLVPIVASFIAVLEVRNTRRRRRALKAEVANQTTRALPAAQGASR